MKTVRGKNNLFLYVKLPIILMFITAITQIFLSIIGVISLSGLLFMKQQIVAGLEKEDLSLNEQVIEEIHSLTPPFIISSITLLICGFVLSIIIIRQALKYRKKNISILPLSFFIVVHLLGVFSDVLRDKEDPLGFSIIGVLILLCIISLYFIFVRGALTETSYIES